MPVRLIVDAMNVIGSRPDGWWRAPDAAKARLIDRLRLLARESGDQIEVVFDGRPIPGFPEGERDGVFVRFAGHSARNAADDGIVAIVSDRSEQVTVVTSDRDLRQRVEALGARVEGASWLLRRLDQAEERARSGEPGL